MDYKNEFIIKNPDFYLKDSNIRFNELLNFIPKKMQFQSMIDIGCGTGFISLELAKALKLQYFEGIDISQLMINKARTSDSSRLGTWKRRDLFNYKTKRIFDLVVCNDIMEHIHNDTAFFKKVSSLGKYILIKIPLENSYFVRFMRKFNFFDYWKNTEERFGHVHHYWEDDLYRLISQCNLRIAKEELLPMHKRSSKILEFFRLFFYPISIFSMRNMVKIYGGLKLVLLINDKNLNGPQDKVYGKNSK